jgi:hypothetical protein
MDNKELLANLYDTIYDLITATPKKSEGTGFSPDTVCVQMTQGEVLNLEEFTDALSSGNPQGNIVTAETLSNFVDKVPNLAGTQWAPKDGLARAYKEIVEGANIDLDQIPSQNQEELYKKMQGILKINVKHTSLVTGTITETIEDSPLFTGYQEAQEEYVTALLDATQVMLDADLSTNHGKRQANLDKRRADAEVKAKYKLWVAAGKSDVDEVLDALETIKNNAISATINDAKEIMQDNKWFATNADQGPSWMLSSVTPSNFTEPTIKGTTIKLSSDKLKTGTSKTATTYSNNSRGWFWHGGNSSSGLLDTKNVSMEAESFTLEAELVLVRIHRPWLNQLLFSMKGWNINAFTDDNLISDGEGGGALPGIPSAFVMLRNVSIEAKFNQSDSDLIHKRSQTNHSSGWGWGPFGGGNHKTTSESTTDNFSSSANGVKLSFSQPQVVAWISNIVPNCPPSSK